MPIGNQPTITSLNGIAGNLTVTLRDVMASIQRHNAYLQDLGQDGMVALGFASNDAARMLTIFSNLDTIITACCGNGGTYEGPALPYDFVSETIPLWGGQ